MRRKYATVLKILGVIMLLSAAAMLPALTTSLVYGEDGLTRTFAFCILISAAGGGLLSRFIKSPRRSDTSVQSTYIIATLCWLFASLIGMLPYFVSEYTNNFADAFFESVAGFTTTGATVSNIDLMPKSLMMWKACSHWLGGMGILVLAVSVLPALGISGQSIMKAETPASADEKISSRISDTAKLLYLTYGGFTLAEFLLLIPSKMSVYDAIINTLGNVSTAGLFSRSLGLMYYDSLYIEAVMGIFAILVTVNFSLYIGLLQGKGKNVFKNSELRAYLALILISGCAVSLSLFFSRSYDSLAAAFRYGILQTVSFATTAGYGIVDYNNWPPLCIALLMLLGFIGGCTSSTSTGLKISRLLIVFKLIKRGFFKRLHPRAVVPVRLGEQIVSSDAVTFVSAYTFLYIAVFAIGSLLLSLQGLDFLTTISTSVAAISNTGATFGLSGASSISDFSIFAPPLKLLLSFMMIMGRLEIVAVLMLFVPSFWKK